MSATESHRLLGHVHFDSANARSTLSDILTLSERTSAIFRNKYVRIEQNDGRTFLGRIVDGPFYVPEEVSRDSAFAQTAILHGDEFPATPSYYVLSRVEVLGELRGSTIATTPTRPSPKSQVCELGTDDIMSLIGIKGDMVLGTLSGYPEVVVSIDSKAKNVLPRNVGIFGTVGSGKTNTAQVLIEEASRAGYAVIVLDVEGEYTSMSEPTTEKSLIPKLELVGRRARGLENLHVYYPAGGESWCSTAKQFGIPFRLMSPYVVSELAGLTEPQEGVFLTACEALRSKSSQSPEGTKPRSKAIAFLEGGTEEDQSLTLQSVIDELPHHGAQAGPGTMWALKRKLTALARTGIFDAGDPLDLSVVLKPHTVTIIDVSGTQNDVAKNIAIAWVLRSVFEYKLAEGNNPPTLLVIEEAHTFISKESRDRMAATMDMLKLIARRGRKRWLGLVFVSQQPSHLPEEIFELCNTRIVHCIKSEYNLNPLKHTSGDIVSELWDMVPGLGPGQALVTCPQFGHAVLVEMRPSETCRRLVD